MNWLKNKLRNWLGISKNEDIIMQLYQLHSDLTTIGVDVHFKTPHMIIIFSKLKGGQVRHIDAQFDSISELNHLTKQLKEKYRPKDIIYDLPMGMDRRIFD